MGGLVGGGSGNGNCVGNSPLSLLLFLSHIFKLSKDSVLVYSDSGGVGGNLGHMSDNSAAGPAVSASV